MGRALSMSGFVLAGLFVLVVVAVPLAVGVRPIVGPRVRALTDHRFDATSSQSCRLIT